MERLFHLLVLSSAALVVLMCPASAADNNHEDWQLLDQSDFELARTFNGFNSTYLLAAVAVGAVLVLLVGVGLYLYDVYADTSKTDPYPNPEYSAYYSEQYNNAQYAYPAVTQQYHQRRYASILYQKQTTPINNSTSHPILT